MTVDAVPESAAVPEGDHRYRLAVAVNRVMGGNTNNVGSFTLTANVATTTVTDNQFAIGQGVWWVPLTANAAAAQAGMYISERKKGEFTITHANNAQTDRDFLYVRFG